MTQRILTLALLLGVLAARPAPAEEPADAPADNLEYWLSQAEQAPATRPAASAPAIAPTDAPPRPDALPGVIELSDGRLLAGWVFTTVEQPFLVHEADLKRWRRLPLLAALSIEAVVVERRMELRWRWKAMGEPEKVYTGRKYPFRRYLWKFRLLDGTEVAGTVKGQPLWVEHAGERHGPFVLHERHKGEDGQSLRQLVYVRRVLISRRAMEAALRAPASQPAGR